MEASKTKSKILIHRERETQKWHVLYIKSRKEKSANRLLNEAGFRTYLPLQKRLKVWKFRKEWVEEPIFNSYLFIKIKRNELHNVLHIPYVMSYVRFEGEPAIIREEELLFIKRMLLNETSFEVIKGKISIGQEITIKSGPFKGLKGNVSEVRGKNSLVVQMKSLNTNIVIPMTDFKSLKDKPLKTPMP